MNGLTGINEQLIGKFHGINIEKIPGNNPEEIIPLIPDESGCASRFQMIRVDRNFGRGRWKVNDYEPPENTSTSANLPVNTIENEPINNSNISATGITGDSNTTSSQTLTATVASAAAAVAAAAAFQQRMALNSSPPVMPTANVPPQGGHLHGFPPSALANQPYLLTNHHQFGYYPYYPPPYSPYAAQWAAATLNHYLQHPTLAPPSSMNHNESLRHSDTDINGETPNNFQNPTADHVQNAQLAAAAAFLYGTQHSHTPYGPQVSSAASPYATIPSYHPVPPPPTIIPPQTLSLSQTTPYNTNDIQQSLLSSPKQELNKNFIQPSSLINTPKSKPFNGINNDLISSIPVTTTSQSSFISSPTNAPTASLNNIWSYTTNVPTLNLTQTAAVTAVAAMGLLSNQNNPSTKIANEILKELTTPTKQNNAADIDNKISAAMDLVKMHLLSAVREEVTELRQQIRTLNEKVNSVEHENAFLRQHVPSEIYGQYIPAFSCSNDSTTNTLSSIPLSSSSQPIPMTSLSSIPPLSTQQSNLSTNNL